MQSVRSRIWTHVAVSISYDDNDYTTGTSLIVFMMKSLQDKYFYVYWSQVTECISSKPVKNFYQIYLKYIKCLA